MGRICRTLSSSLILTLTTDRITNIPNSLCVTSRCFCRQQTLGLRESSALDPDTTDGAIDLTVSSRRAEWAPGTSAIVPAVTDAIFAATGKRKAKPANRE